MLQKQFMRINLNHLRERITIKLIKDGVAKSATCFAYVYPLLENKNHTKARVVFIFHENKFLFDGPSHFVHLDWNSKGHIAFDVHKLKPHLLICVATQTVSSHEGKHQDQRSEQTQKPSIVTAQ